MARRRRQRQTLVVISLATAGLVALAARAAPCYPGGRPRRAGARLDPACLPRATCTKSTCDETLDVVVATCDDAKGLKLLRAVVRTSRIGACCARWFVYEKCKAPARGATRLENVGREQHTYLAHITTHYDDLASHVLFTPSNLERSLAREEHRRKTQKPGDRRDFILEHVAAPPSLACTVAGRLGQDKGFKRALYHGRDLARPRVLGLKRWAHARIGSFPEDAPLCRGGVVFTTGARLRVRSRAEYARLRDELAVPEPEAGHYLERLAWLYYGGECRGRGIGHPGPDGSMPQILFSNCSCPSATDVAPLVNYRGKRAPRSLGGSCFDLDPLNPDYH